jgi:hypothetical protein
VKAHPNGIITARSALVFYRYQKVGTEPPPLTLMPEAGQ